MHTNIGSGVSVFHHILIEFINKIIKKKKKPKKLSSSFIENVMCTALSTYYRRVYKTLVLIGFCFFGQPSTKRSIQPKLAMPSFYATLPFLLFECGM